MVRFLLELKVTRYPLTEIMKTIFIILICSFSLVGQIKPDSTYVTDPIKKELLIVAKSKESLLIKLDSLIKVKDLEALKIKNFYPKGIVGEYIIYRKTK